MNLKQALEKRVVFVAEAPGRSSPRAKYGTGDGRCQRRLAKLMGISVEEFSERFAWVNLLGRWPGKNGKGDAFDVRAGKREAERLRRHLRGNQIIVLLGQAVARSFGPEYMMDVGFGRVSVAETGELIMWVVLPHPSGVNRWWNNPRNVSCAQDILKRLGWMLGLLVSPAVNNLRTGER